MSLVTDVVTRLVCAVRGHSWQPFYKTRRSPLRYGERDYCVCCRANRVRFEDGEVVATADDVQRGAPEWMEAMYLARWGDLPKQRTTMGGQLEVR